MSCDEEIQDAISTIDTKLNSSDAINKLNTALEFLRENTNCDSECQKEKEIERLRLQWIQTKNQLNNLPKIVNQNEKDYWVAAESLDYYNNNILKEEYYQQILRWRQIEKKKFSEIYEIMLIKLKSYEIETYSLSKLKQLFEEVTKKNEKLKNNIDNYYSKNNTNSRKVWYQDQDLNKLESIQYILKIFYFGVFFGYIIFSGFIKNAGYKNKKVVLLLLIYLSIPFTLKYILSFTLELINNYYDTAPS